MSHDPLQSDVRMRGFARRSTVEQALAWLDAQLRATPPLSSEIVPLAQASGRVLAAEVASQVDVPGFARSMMDGYALRAVESHGASPYNPLTLRIVGQCLPGRPYEGTIIGPGEAVRIMTGAPLPAGTDAVLPVEQIETRDELLLAQGEVSPGKHVAQRGEDVRAGEVVLARGRVLRPQDLGVLASIGVGSVPIVRRPRVRIVVTGNELLPAGSVPHDAQIVDANGPMLTALVIRDGGTAIYPGIVPDHREAIRQALTEDCDGNPPDVVLVSGGSSVGQEDHVPMLLAEHGELAIHGIAMRPSSPAGMGRLGERFVFLLPGNPVSCLCAYDFFAGRAVRMLGGSETIPAGEPVASFLYRRTTARLRRKLVSVVGRVDYARVKLIDGEVEPLSISGAAVLSSTTRADGFVVIPADSEGYAPGTEVTVHLYSSDFHNSVGQGFPERPPMH